MALLEGRKAVITGAAQGLGLSIARCFVAEGARVAMADIQGGKLQAACARVSSDGRAFPLKVDTTSVESVRAMVAEAAQKLGGIDILVNVAGGSGTEIIEGIEDLEDALWRRVIEGNLHGTFNCCKAAAPFLRKSSHGRVINFSSSSLRGVKGKSSVAARHAYAAAKAGIHGFSNQLACDLGEAGVAVAVILPAFILTEPGARVHEVFYGLTEAERATMLSRLPEPPRQPDDIGWAVTFLASDHGAGLAGTVVRLKGPIPGPKLKLVQEAMTPLGALARVEAA